MEKIITDINNKSPESEFDTTIFSLKNFREKFVLTIFLITVFMASWSFYKTFANAKDIQDSAATTVKFQDAQDEAIRDRKQLNEKVAFIEGKISILEKPRNQIQNQPIQRP